MDSWSSPQSRAERLLAIGRVVLATVSLLAVWLAPFQPAKYAPITNSLLAGYVTYALLMALLVWHSEVLMVRLRFLTHAVDLTVFFFFMYFAETPANPFLVYFVFSLVSAALYWQWRGVSWTAVGALAVCISMGVYATKILRDPDFEPNRFTAHSMYLVMVATLLGNLGAYQQRLQRAAAAEERIRLARDLHDGLLQSLAGAALQLETVRILLDKNPQVAQEQLLDLQIQLAVEQSDLRVFIQELRLVPFSSHKADFSLTTRLKELSERIERQWGVSVVMQIERLTAEIPTALTRDLYRIVQEALSNAARHAHATTIHVTLSVEDSQVRLTVADNGRGFPFHGHYDLATLTALNLGPAMLKERVVSLGGSLVIDSAEAGARLHITLPLVRPGA